MNRKLLALALSAGMLSTHAQYSENFDSYTVGAYIGVQSSAWTTWSSTVGGSEDAQINNVQSNSPSNSIYFNSTAANGGPQDVVLPFGGMHNLGQFTYSHSMYIPSGKGAYFNFQADATIGNTWAMDFYFIDDNNYYVTAGGATVASGTYSSDQWIDFAMDIDLSTNQWEMSLNGVVVATFANSVNRIASIDFYPTNSSYGGNGLSTFWIDDVAYQHFPYVLPAENGAVINIDLNGPAINGASRNPKVEVRNLGLQPITSFDITLDYNGSQITQSVTGVNIASLGTYEVELNQSATLTSSATSISATISNVNGNGADADPSDDTKTVNFNAITPAAGKVVIVEEATGTWCGWCPRGTVAMDILGHDYKGFAAGIAVHNNDPMVNAVYDNGIGNFIAGYPSALVNRGSDIDPSEIFAPVMTDLVVAPTAVLTNGARYDAITGLLEVSVTADFAASVSGDWRLACVITEDSVTGTASGYGQANYYSNSSSLIDRNGIDWQNLPNPVPASQMVYDHVARAISPSFEGYQNSFPATVNANDQHTVNFWIPINAEWDMDKMHIVSMLIKPNGEIDNGGEATYSEAVANGFVAGPNVSVVEYFDAPDKSLNVYPNPSRNEVTYLTVNGRSEEFTVSVMDINGKQVYQQTVTDQIGVPTALQINTANLANGIYMIKLVDGRNIYTEKLVVE